MMRKRALDLDLHQQSPFKQQKDLNGVPQQVVVTKREFTGESGLGLDSGRRQVRFWLAKEDEALRKAVEKYGPDDWDRIAAEVPRRTKQQCKMHWRYTLDPSLVKGAWSKEEDELLIKTIRKYRSTEDVNWNEVTKCIKGRLVKQVKERWFQHLDPNIKRDLWTPEEDARLLEYAAILNCRWAPISRELHGRTEHAVKCRYKKLTKRVAGGGCRKNMRFTKHRNTIIHPDNNGIQALPSQVHSGFQRLVDTSTAYLAQQRPQVQQLAYISPTISIGGKQTQPSVCLTQGGPQPTLTEVPSNLIPLTNDYGTIFLQNPTSGYISTASPQLAGQNYSAAHQFAAAQAGIDIQNLAELQAPEMFASKRTQSELLDQMYRQSGGLSAPAALSHIAIDAQQPLKEPLTSSDLMSSDKSNLLRKAYMYAVASLASDGASANLSTVPALGGTPGMQGAVYQLAGGLKPQRLVSQHYPTWSA